MSAPIGRLVAALESAGCNPRRSGEGWSARCPGPGHAHGDRNPSLSAWEKDGAAWLKCHAGQGCAKEAILAPLRLTLADLFPQRATTNGAPTRHDYVDEGGKVLMTVCRLGHGAAKKVWREPGGVRDVPLYRLPEVLAAEGRKIFVVEGEKCVDAVVRAGAVATCSPGGAGKWRPEHTRALEGASEIVVVADHDQPGIDHARAVVDALVGVGVDARAFLPARRRPTADGYDIADQLAEGGMLEDLDPMPEGPPVVGDPSVTEGDGEKSDKKSAATTLVEIAEETYRFGIADDGESFAVPRQGPQVVALLRGGKSSLRAQMARRFFTRIGKAAPQQALADALLVIEGMAQDEEPEELHLRVAQHGGATWLDLGDHTGRAVRITGAGWTVEDQAPVLFKRSAINAALPIPARGGSLDHLWQWLNVTAEDQVLVVAWLIAALTADVPHPILGLFGEQGTGKTTAQKVIVSALDPGPAPTRKPPRDGEAWVTAAAGSWIVGLDNLSAISDWLSDSLCRAVTGDGDVRRKLYTDGGLHIISFRRCIAITGIDLGAVRGDLAERLLPIELDRIADEDRLEEGEMWPRWHQDHPLILGALLDLAASVNHALPFVRLERKPRMADYARVLAGVDAVLGTNGVARYWAKQGTLATESLSGDSFITAIPARFEGSSGELLDLVTPEDERWRAPKGWPANARAVTQLLRRQAPPMRKAGWVVTDDDGANQAKVVRWTIARPEIACNRPPPDPSDPPNHDQTGQTGQTGHEYEQSQDDEEVSGGLALVLAAFPDSVVVDHPEDLVDLPLDEVGACRICRATTVSTDGSGPICKPCHAQRWAS